MTTAQLHGHEVAAVIRSARLALDITKAEAARRAGVSRRTWHEIEEGQRRSTSAETLAQFDQVLGFEEGTLFSMSASAGDREIEALRRRTAVVLSSLGVVELTAILEQAEGVISGSLRDEVDALRNDLALLRAELSTFTAKSSEPRGSGRPRGSRSTPSDRSSGDDR